MSPISDTLQGFLPDHTEAENYPQILQLSVKWCCWDLHASALFTEYILLSFFKMSFNNPDRKGVTLLLLINPSPFDSAMLVKSCECTVCQRKNYLLSLTSKLLQAYMWPLGVSREYCLGVTMGVLQIIFVNLMTKTDVSKKSLHRV